ncbi:hypothetical protein [Pseudomonas lundensis]|uniref:hypothetical protein n=1 Tax=Pseudomonas lundensis TaxID=86185 RepID=UPI000641C80A|nr:hypothetical protein [Pseudomonas lundensis]NNA29170.1 hypothetical protein [Pseudomonas lundensis]NNA38351.1 hypothetical protein [Pseudomonas lundensis]
MQNELKQAIRFDDFYALFGDRGVVAMAWWLGGQLAEPIREEQWSFPFLHICGEAGSGKTFLLEYLSKLTGPQSVSHHDPVRTTRAARTRTITNPVNRVVIYEPTEPTASEFDWDELKALYNTASFYIHSGNIAESVEHTFKGALVICANQPVEYSEAVETRLARIVLNKSHHANPRQAESLLQLSAEQAGIFGLAITRNTTKLLNDINKLAPTYTAALLKEHGDQLSARAAKNGGQLMALIDVLNLILGLSNTQHTSALRAVKYCVCAEFVPY